MHKFLMVLTLLLSIGIISACQGDDTMTDNFVENPIISIDVKDFGVMVVELDFEAAPNSVRNFVHLAKDGFYDGLIFHRVIEGFMIQGGHSQSETCAIAGEFASNGHENPIPHERGVISMARTQIKDSATSQFFIVHQSSPHLDGEYAAFGRMIEGFDVLDAIATVEVSGTQMSPQPVNDVIIESVDVDLRGSTFAPATCVE